MAESMAVRWSDALIADAQGIADYYDAEFGAPTELIAYGAPILVDERSELIAELGLSSRAATTSSWPASNRRTTSTRSSTATGAATPAAPGRRRLGAVRRRVHRADPLAGRRPRAPARLGLGPGPARPALCERATYLHGHSVGGTNPSLLRAIGAGAATIAYDVDFNREVLERSGRYFRTAEDVAAEIEIAEKDEYETVRRGALARARALRYDWDEVAGRYEQLCTRLATAGVTPRRRRAGSASGRRRGVVLS